MHPHRWRYIGGSLQCDRSRLWERRRLAEQFVLWLFEKYFIPLLQVRVILFVALTLQASFYATETAAARYETVYYAHDAWASATEPHLRDLESSLLEELTMVS